MKKYPNEEAGLIMEDLEVGRPCSSSCPSCSCLIVGE